MLGPTNLVDMVGRKEEAMASARQLYQVNPPETNLFTCSFWCTLLSLFFVSYRHQLPELETKMKEKSSHLMPATPLAQSSEPPDAAYCKHVVHYHLYHLYHYYLHFIVGLCGSWFRLLIKIRNIFGINIVWWKKKKIRVDSTFAINNVHAITYKRTTFILKSEGSMDSPGLVGDF